MPTNDLKRSPPESPRNYATMAQEQTSSRREGRDDLARYGADRQRVEAKSKKDERHSRRATHGKGERLHPTKKRELLKSREHGAYQAKRVDRHIQSKVNGERSAERGPLGGQQPDDQERARYEQRHDEQDERNASLKEVA